MWHPKEQRASMLAGWDFRTNLKGELASMNYRKRRPGTESDEVKSRSPLLCTVMGINFSKRVMTM